MAHHTGRVAETVPLTMRDSALTSALAGAYRKIPYGFGQTLGEREQLSYGLSRPERVGVFVHDYLKSRAVNKNLLSTTPSPCEHLVDATRIRQMRDPV